MMNNSKFESRTGKLSCTDAELFGFICDIRNMGQFIPGDTMANWNATADSCNFNVPPFGVIRIRITEKRPYSLVSFSGDAFDANSFNINVSIEKNANNLAAVRITLTADLNPLLKAMASGPIDKFLDTLITEMEKFDRWDVTFKENQPL